MSTFNRSVTINAYNKNAENYAEKFMDFKSYKDKILLFQKNYIPENSYILDVGCGPGNNAKLLFEADNSYKITGMDLSVEMINIAKRNAPGCNFQVQDIRDIIPDKKYDAIIASFCIVHLSDEETSVLINRLSEMLKKNGTIFLSFMEGKKSGFETTSFSDDMIFFNYYKRDMIKNLLEKNSIKPVEVLTEDYQESDGSVTDDVFIFARK